MTFDQVDLTRALDAHVTLNLDNEREAEVVDQLLKGPCKESK